MKERKLKAYMGYSRSCEPIEGAVLIFDYSAREARKNHFHGLITDICDGDYLDFACRAIKDESILEYAKSDKPHTIESPPLCRECNLWGTKIGDDGLCNLCREMIQENIRIAKMEGIIP